MARLKRVEKAIWDVEGFDIDFLHEDGRDLRSDREGIPAWPFERAARNDSTVATWIETRFKPTYSGFGVRVIDGDGNVAAGNMKLGTLRDSYADD